MKTIANDRKEYQKWKGIDFPTELKNCKTFEKSNLTISLNILFGKKIKKKQNKQDLNEII